MNRKVALVVVAAFLMFAALLLSVSQAGTTWNIQTADSSADTVGWYTSIALDSASHPCISYYDTTAGNLKYAKWTGSAWSTQSVATAGDVGQYSSLAFDSSGYPCISYFDYTNFDLKFARWTGAAWSVQTVDSTGDVGEYTSLALDWSGYPCISYLDNTNGDLKYAVSLGSSWASTTVVSTGDVGAYSSLEFDSSGYPCISYYDYGNDDLKFARWTGAAWSVQTVDSTGDVGAYSSLEFDSSGYPCIGYYGNGDLKFARWTGAAWSVQTVDSTGNVGGHLSLALDSSDYPCISYYDQTNYDLKFARWTGSAWSIQTVDSTGDVGEYTSLALDLWGNPYISYFDASNLNLKCASGQDANPTGSITVNSGATYSGSTSVTLSLSYTAYGATITDVRYSNDGTFDTEPWETPAATKAWTLTSGDGSKVVYYRVRDSDGMYSTYTDSIILDTTAPSGSVTINGGASYTASTSVTLSLTYSDVLSGISQVRYSNDGVWDTEPWEAPAITKAWTLPIGEGVKNVYYQVKDIAGMLSPTYSDSIYIDTTAPTGSISINSGAEFTNSTSVLLSLTYYDAGSGVSAVRYTTDGIWDTEPWEAPSLTKAFTLWPLNAQQSVGYQIKDNVGLVSQILSDTIVLDDVPPYGKVIIDGGEEYATGQLGFLSLTYSDATSGVEQVRYSNDGVWDTEPWEFATNTRMGWSLTFGEGTKTVYYQVRDNAMNIATYSDTVVLDITSPTGSILINNGGEYTDSTSVLLSLTYSDATSGVEQVRYSNDGVWDTEPWEFATNTRSWTLWSGSGTKFVYFQVRDRAGHVSQTYSDYIILSPSGPAGTQLTIEVIGEGNTNPPVGSYTYSSGTHVTVSADRHTWGWEFDYWLLDGEKVGSYPGSYVPYPPEYTVIMDANHTLTAVYTDQVSHVELQVGGGEGTTSPSPSSYQMKLGTDFYVEAIPAINFAYWLLDGENVSSSSTYTLKTSGEYLTLIAIFEEEWSPSFTLSLQVEGSGRIFATPDTYEITQDIVEVAVFPDEGWELDYYILDEIELDASSTNTTMYVIGYNRITLHMFSLSDEMGTYNHSLVAVFRNQSEPKSCQLDVSYEDDVYVVEVSSNSSVTDLVFSQEAKRLMFSVSGTEGTTGVCNITFPVELLSGNFTVLMDDTLLTEGVDYTVMFNGTHYTLNISYGHSSHVIEVFATNAIPDFAAWLFMPFLMSATLLILAFGKELKKQQSIKKRQL
jgi:hypothetical protein